MFGVRHVWTTPRALKTWTSGLFLALGLLARFGLASSSTASLGLFGYALPTGDLALLVGIVIGGEPFLTSGLRALRRRRATLAVLEAFAIVVATALGLFVEAAVLAFLINVAELLEAYAMDRVQDSLEELVDLTPDTARVRRDGTERTLPAEEVSVGDVILVRPGEKVPLDGTVLDGTSTVDQSPVTGESVPVDKEQGNEAYAGSLNEEGYLEIEATTTVSETTIAQVARLVQEDRTNESEVEQSVDRLARYYTPIVAGGAILFAVLPPLLGLGTWETWFVRGLTLVVIACPCAFVISTPVSVISGLTRAAKSGVLIKGGQHLEALSHVDTVAFDKTGTLTTGDLSVTDVVSARDRTDADLLTVATALEVRSEHPIASAIGTYADENGVHGATTPDVSDFEALTGAGVKGVIDGTTYYVGKPDLFADLDVPFDPEGGPAVTDGGTVSETVVPTTENPAIDEETLPDARTVSSLEREGKTVVLVGSETTLYGAIALADRPRPEARSVVEWLQARGITTAMLTGDNERTARAVATELGIEEYHAGLHPDEKLNRLKRLQMESRSVVMVGDGINDAPALTTATVGIAMGAVGSDTALETADIALMDDDLSKLPTAYLLSQRTTRVITQNVWASLGIEGILAVAAPLGLVGPVVAVLLGDAGLVLAVTLNALQLSRMNSE